MHIFSMGKNKQTFVCMCEAGKIMYAMGFVTMGNPVLHSKTSTRDSLGQSNAIVETVHKMATWGYSNEAWFLQ